MGPQGGQDGIYNIYDENAQFEEACKTQGPPEMQSVPPSSREIHAEGPGPVPASPFEDPTLENVG